ncbi:DNA-binding protein [Burkholderia cenocepacia]|uniref:DNA-binding protein n=1 Tax=Burkholderia cenocepacia TaxID=95486 RepID=UPI002655243C|nr:DNA-binding protein [Burkholderia cenocepacia]MDN7821716.1 DNA-binding protein [Burkholderia cenocepacia]HEM9000720.1 DNA-binding protein [Burkholderia cenocepacia]
MVKTRTQVRDEFAKKGWSYSSWATKNGFPTGLVTQIINDDDVSPKRTCRRGTSHNIAVKLGLKEGEVSTEMARA